MTKQYEMMKWTDEKIKKFWDYESQYPENYFTYQVGNSVVDRLYKYFRHAKNALDYGAGAGFLIPHLMNKGIEVSALEFSLASLVEINKKFSGKKYFKGAFTYEELSGTGQKFDLIMVLEVLEHLNDNYLFNLADNIARLLSKNGVAIFTTPNDEDLTRSMVYCPESDVIFHRWQHVRSWSEESLYQFLIQCRFEVVGIFTTNFSLPEKKSSLLSKIYALLNPILKRPTKRQEGPHLVAIAKSAGSAKCAV